MVNSDELDVVDRTIREGQAAMQLTQFRRDRGGGARQWDPIAVAAAAAVVHHCGAELRNPLLDSEIVQTDRARARQEHDGRPATAHPMHEYAAAVNLLEPSDRRSGLN